MTGGTEPLSAPITRHQAPSRPLPLNRDTPLAVPTQKMPWTGPRPTAK